MHEPTRHPGGGLGQFRFKCSKRTRCRTRMGGPRWVFRPSLTPPPPRHSHKVPPAAATGHKHTPKSNQHGLHMAQHDAKLRGTKQAAPSAGGLPPKGPRRTPVGRAPPLAGQPECHLPHSVGALA